MLSHDGTTITLLDRPGPPGRLRSATASSATTSILDDEGTGGAIEDEGNFGSPFDPDHLPAQLHAGRSAEHLRRHADARASGRCTSSSGTSTRPTPSTSWGLTITRAGTPVDPDNCVGGPGDANGDGLVDVDDLVMVILGWGPCADPPGVVPGRRRRQRRGRRGRPGHGHPELELSRRCRTGRHHHLDSIRAAADLRAAPPRPWSTDMRSIEAYLRRQRGAGCSQPRPPPAFPAAAGTPLSCRPSTGTRSSRVTSRPSRRITPWRWARSRTWDCSS